jgi:hypothetical protein
MKRAVLIFDPSPDQNPQMQLLDLRPLGGVRGFHIVGEYSDTISTSLCLMPGAGGSTWCSCGRSTA